VRYNPLQIVWALSSRSMILACLPLSQNLFRVSVSLRQVIVLRFSPWGGIGVSALHQLDRLVFAHDNRHLDAAFVFRRVGNIVPFYDPTKGAKREKLLADADMRLTEVAISIDKVLIVQPDIALLSAFLKRFTYDGFIRRQQKVYC
jgi:hypothetical protein